MTTKEEILEVIEALVAEGETPTNVAVRTRLGGGSFTTIAPVLRAWKLQAQQGEAPVAPIPEELAQLVARLQDGVWRSAVSLAHEKVVLIEQNARLRIRDLEDECDELTVELQRLEAANDVLGAAAERDKAIHAELREQVVLGTERLQQAEAAARDAKEQLLAAQTRLEHLTERSAQETARAQALDAQLATANESVRALEVQLREQNAHAERAEATSSDATRRLEALSDEHQALREAEGKVRLQVQALQSEKTTLSSQLSLLERELEEARQAHQALEQKSAAASAAEHAAREKAAELEGSLKTLRETMQEFFPRKRQTAKAAE